MAHVHRSTPADAGSTHPVVVIHCSDPRYQPHFQHFMRHGLRLDRYSLLAVPGGPQCFTLEASLPKCSWAAMRWMKFLVDLTHPSRVVLIAHDDCRWYVDNQFAEAASARDRQLADMRDARVVLLERFGPVPVEFYYATLRDGAADFEQLS
jgi:hypothetical protein